MQNTEAKLNKFGAVDEVDWLHVVAAVIVRDDHAILLAQRPLEKHQGGKWEFPGGKVESNEQPCDALVRELDEEIGIQADPAAIESFIEIRHSYPDKHIFLDVWRVTGFAGKPYGREGQKVRWFEINEIAELVFPAANAPIVDALLKVYRR